eukprot:TRINITY_DN2729_c1_g2_i1.p1 TRINITY_DN2729_c1_g2~~TRINITY_DN2729_c1_g2_i1.p1  ORF type:complete len:565 (+),score=119.24 TRINITY_DN2729_c1_g2_i1:83-1696(+)
MGEQSGRLRWILAGVFLAGSLALLLRGIGYRGSSPAEHRAPSAARAEATASAAPVNPPGGRTGGAALAPAPSLPPRQPPPPPAAPDPTGRPTAPLSSPAPQLFDLGAQRAAAGLGAAQGQLEWPGAASLNGPGGYWREAARGADASKVLSMTHDQRNQDSRINNDPRGWMDEFAAVGRFLASTRVGEPFVWRDSPTGLRVALVQMLTHTDPVICALLRVAVSRGWAVNLVGFGADVKRARTVGWVRGVLRQAVLADAIAGVPDDVVVLVTDSFDVALQLSPAEFAARWEWEERWRGPGVLYSAETGCWPFAILARGCPEWPRGCERFPSSPLGGASPRFLNAGVFAARGRDLKRWLDGLSRLSTSTPRRCLYDDQAPHGWRWIQSYEAGEAARLDHAEWMAKNTNCAAEKVVWDAAQKVFVHSPRITNWSAPVAMHTNGDKHPLPWLVAALDRDINPAGRCVNVDGVQRDLGQMCGASPRRDEPRNGMRYRYSGYCQLPPGSTTQSIQRRAAERVPPVGSRPAADAARAASVDDGAP